MEPGGYTENWECELRGCPNTILTPHIGPPPEVRLLLCCFANQGAFIGDAGGSTEEAQTSISVDVATKIANFINAGSTIGAVNFPEIGLPYGGPQTHRILNIHRNKPGVLRVCSVLSYLLFILTDAWMWLRIST